MQNESRDLTFVQSLLITSWRFSLIFPARPCNRGGRRLGKYRRRSFNGRAIERIVSCDHGPLTPRHRRSLDGLTRFGHRRVVLLTLTSLFTSRDIGYRSDELGGFDLPQFIDMQNFVCSPSRDVDFIGHVINFLNNSANLTET